MAARAQWYNHTKFDLGKVGKMLHIFPGEKLNFLRSEHPNENYKPFANRCCRRSPAVSASPMSN